MKKILVSLGIAVVFAVIFGLINNYIYQEKQGGDLGSQVSYEPYRATLSGVQTCLPHKDTSGPQTLECAIGIETDAGEYYSLDFNLMSQIPVEIQNGERFTASGIVTPIERLSTNHWQKYNVQGIFSVTDSVQIDGTIVDPFFTWRYEEDDSLNLDGNPQTNIFLEVKYSDGIIQSKLIDTTPGSCNDLPDSDEDTVPHSTNIQCYSAGLGYRFKITKGETSYRVERKTFEEALPDYNPSLYEYEVIAEFPLSY